MIINNRYQGPRYSTDSTAHDVRRFVDTSASHAKPTAHRHAGPALEYSFDQLYPSLAAPSVTPKTSIFSAIVRRFKTFATALRPGRGPIAHS